MNNIFSSMLTAFTVGLSCGTCCSPLVGTFLSTWLVSRGENIRGNVRQALLFFAGKILSVSILCAIASIIGLSFVSKEGCIGSFPFRSFMQVLMSAYGIAMAARFLFMLNGRKGFFDECSGCHAHKNSKVKRPSSMLLSGILYGMMPCIPLVMMIGYCAGKPFPLALILGICFSGASMISPLLLLAVIFGALSKQIKKEIPYFMKWFRFASYITLAVLPFTITR